MVDRSRALTWTELRLGVVVIGSLVVLAFTTLYIGSGGGSPFAKKYTVKALMADVNGLKAGAPVRVGGVEVGTVTDVEFARASAGMVEVTMKLDSRVKDRVTSQSQATLGALGLLGEKAVDISSGMGGVSVPDQGYVSAAAEDPFKGLLSDASESTAHLKRILARMDAGEGLIGKALRDEELYDRMNDVAGRLQAVLGKLESPRGPLGRMMNDEEMSRNLAGTAKGIASVVSRIESGQGPLGALSRDEDMVREMKAITANLNQVSGRIARGEGSLGRMMSDEKLYESLSGVSTRLDALLLKIEKGDGSMGRLINDPEFYNNVNGAAKDMRQLIGDMRRDPQKYLRVKLSLF
jgi:phospholipid/cholesterol/gamma-HCH transport system substrate-binding protein